MRPRMTRVALSRMLDAIELGQVPLEKLDQPIGAALDGLGTDLGVVQECLGFGVIQERHGDLRSTYDVSSPSFIL